MFIKLVSQMAIRPAGNARDATEPENIRRHSLEILPSRLFLLKGRDKIIMSMYFENGRSYRQIALLLKMSHSSVLRRIKKIKRTLDIYVSCLNNPEHFTPKEISIARDYFLMGFSIRQIAHKKKASYYNIRNKIKEIRHTVNTL